MLHHSQFSLFILISPIFFNLFYEVSIQRNYVFVKYYFSIAYIYIVNDYELSIVFKIDFFQGI